MILRGVREASGLLAATGPNRLGNGSEPNPDGLRAEYPKLGEADQRTLTVAYVSAFLRRCLHWEVAFDPNPSGARRPAHVPAGVVDAQVGKRVNPTATRP